MSPQTPPPPPPPRDDRGSGRSSLGPGLPRWSFWVLGGFFILALIIAGGVGGSTGDDIPYSEFLDKVASEQVERIEWNNNNGDIAGTLKDGVGVLDQRPARCLATPTGSCSATTMSTSSSRRRSRASCLDPAAGHPDPVPRALLWWMQRRAQGQMSGIMSIGRCRAKTY